MFTGIIEEVGKISKIEEKNGKKFVSIASSKVIETLKLGDSVSCNGICLTVIDLKNSEFKVEVMAETISKTTARFWKVNDSVNLERALQVGSRFDGHFVQGHVDTIAKRISKTAKGETLYLEYELPARFAEYFVPQGSIAINGVSLTIADLKKDSFQVALIDFTRKETNLENSLYVNLEFDIIGKYVIRFLRKEKEPKITEKMLLENGF